MTLKIKAMKSKIFLGIILALALNPLAGQELSITQKLDLMLMQGQYDKVIDTCRQIQIYDKIDPEIYFRLGLAYINMLDEDRSLENFYQAYSLDPDNKIYSFMLAKAYYGKGKYKPAEHLFYQLSSIDSMNWVYASYLTSIYMLYNRYDEAIDIYRRFLNNDSTNYRYLDKLGFASLKKGDHQYATDLYTKSLSLNEKNLTAIKNLAYLYSANRQSDTAITILTRGIGIDSTDMSLYSMRAQLYYLKNYNKRALDDYLVILSSGDSSELYLKRAGIGYCNNFQPRTAITYLMQAYRIDSSDYETCSYLGQSYFNLNEMERSIYYYKKVINILSPIYKQLGMSYTLMAESQKGNGMYQDAIASFLRALAISDNSDIYMIIANLYDEQLNDSKNAIKYYQAFLDNIKRTGGAFSGKYLDSIKERLEFLKTEPDK
jgi:tetratricopeptide (TPR) repeat protein